MKKRLLSILLTACLLVGLLPTVALAADGDVNYLYCDANGANWQTGTKRTGEYTAITADNLPTAWGTSETTTWYVVQGTVEIGSRVTVSGDVHLILADNCNLTVNGGIQVQDNSDAATNTPNTNALTIYGQSVPVLNEAGTVDENNNKAGKLVAQGVGLYNAAIGGSSGGSGGTITINGGIVTATGRYGAGIGGGGEGGGAGGSGGEITINGGTVKATGNDGGAGIGGGSNGSGGIITINGGTVIATGTKGGAGIGSGAGGGAGNNITINGGTVIATGTNGGAGIGGGNAGGNGGEITISGGTVEAMGEDGGAGIGGGNAGGSGGNITISGGMVEATGIGGGAGIGGGSNGSGGTFQTNNGNAVIFASSIGDQSGKDENASNPWSGVIFEDSEGKVYGTSVTPIEDFTIGNGYTLHIESGKTLTIPESVSMTNYGTLYVDGTLTGAVSGNGGVYYPLTVNGGTASTTYDYNSKTYGKAGETVTLTSTNIPEGQVLDGWTTSNSAVTVENNAFTMPNSALTVTARLKIKGTVSAGDPSKVYDGQPVSMDGKYTVNGTGTVTVEYKAQNAENATYTQSAPTDAGSYTVRISVAASDNYTAASATQDFTITKATQTAPDAPVVKNKTYNSVTLNYIEDSTQSNAKAQYSKDSGTTWQDSPEFKELSPNTAYTFAVRYAETSNYNASNFATIEVTTDYAPVPTYPPTVTQPEEGGTVTTSPKNPTAGSKVTITATPDAGYEVDQVIVTDKNGNPIEVTDNGDGTFSFTQPAGKVTIQVVFRDATVIPFTDVAVDEYYYDAVQWAVKNGITNGTGDGTTFSPNAPCTRAQVVTFLWRAAGCPEPKSAVNPFTDVEAGSYYETAVLWAVENGITFGTSDTTFSPDETCNRAEFSTFLWRSQAMPDAGTSNPFTDVADGTYYTDAVLWAAENDITYGTSATTFSPYDDCTRAQTVTFLYRCLGK